jgi:hypothetical protein
MTQPLTTMAERARALAQEMVLFGHLKGSQWDGLAACLVVFAGSEIARHESDKADLVAAQASTPTAEPRETFDQMDARIAAEVRRDEIDEGIIE